VRSLAFVNTRENIYEREGAAKRRSQMPGRWVDGLQGARQSGSISE